MSDYEWEDDRSDHPVWSSHVWHSGRVWYVSTISRTYDCMAVGSMRGEETLVWECDPETMERGELIHQASGVNDHQAICRSLLATGELPKEDDDE